MARRLKVLVADDEDDIRRGFCRALTKLGCEVVGEASNGLELVELCKAVDADLVITDIRMPVMTGIEAASEIAKTQQTPVIVVSSYERPSGADSPYIAACLLKPVSLSNLEAAILKACPMV